MHFSKPALLCEGCIVKVAWINTEIGGDVVTNHFEPAALLGSEFFSSSFLLGHPGLEIGVHTLGKWDEFVVLVDRKANEGDEISEDPLSGCALNLGLIEGGVCLPELGFGPEMWRFLDSVC